MKNILVTCALPYSNGPIHLGHILEHVQADVWVRYQKLLGNNVYFLCSDDSHGTAILLKSRELNINPKKMISKLYLEHKQQFLNFNISHDFYCTTHNKYNYLFSLYYIKKISVLGLLKKKNIYQFYDKYHNIFLSDRFVIGKCPLCLSNRQYGDSCNVCGNIYNVLDLINPISILSKKKPFLKNSEHLFLNINFFRKKIISWVHNSLLQNEVKNQLLMWLNKNINDWNISRDVPYFGFKIPNIYIKSKYFYVWLDALLSYISNFKYFCEINNLFLFNDFWNINSKYELYHFIGKDILYFHGLLWPSILDSMNFRKPSGLIVHGHLKINSNKMSKSNNNFITSKKWLKYLDSDSLRYFLVSKLSNHINDIDLCMDEFLNKINSDIVNKYINIISRISVFIDNYFNSCLSNNLYDFKFYKYFVNKSILISNMFLNFDYSGALIKICDFCDLVNSYINDKKPWLMDIKSIKLHEFCSTIINIFIVISVYLSPVLPDLSSKIEKYLNIKLTWKCLNKPILGHKLNKYKKLFFRIDSLLIKKIYN